MAMQPIVSKRIAYSGQVARDCIVHQSKAEDTEKMKAQTTNMVLKLT